MAVRMGTRLQTRIVLPAAAARSGGGRRCCCSRWWRTASSMGWSGGPRWAHRGPGPARRTRLLLTVRDTAPASAPRPPTARAPACTGGATACGLVRAAAGLTLEPAAEGGTVATLTFRSAVTTATALIAEDEPLLAAGLQADCAAVPHCASPGPPATVRAALALAISSARMSLPGHPHARLTGWRRRRRWPRHWPRCCPSASLVFRDRLHQYRCMPSTPSGGYLVKPGPAGAGWRPA